MKIILFCSIFILVFAFFIGGFLLIKGKNLGTSKSLSVKVENSRGCKLAINKKYFPPSILDYKLSYASEEKVQAVATYLGSNSDQVDFSIRTVEFLRSLTLSNSSMEGVNSRTVRLMHDPSYIELLTKAWKGKSSQSELDKLVNISGYPPGSLKYQDFNGLRVLDGLGGFLYYDPESQLLLSSYFYSGDKSNYGHSLNKSNYVDYFKDWVRQMC